MKIQNVARFHSTNDRPPFKNRVGARAAPAAARKKRLVQIENPCCFAASGAAQYTPQGKPGRETPRVSDFFDMHSHLLPGFDDGASKSSESLEILYQAWQAGFRHVVATPHVMAGFYEHQRDEVEQAIAALAVETAVQTPGLRLYPGHEYYIDDHFMGWLAQGEIHPLGSGRHVLVELPLLKLPPMTKEIAFRVQIKGLTPILAHPERYNDVIRKPEVIHDLMASGFRMQLNLGSLAGMYGRKVRRTAEWMIKNRLVDFVGSDAHTPQQATEAFTDGLQVLTELVDPAELARLLIRNPRDVLFREETQ